MRSTAVRIVVGSVIGWSLIDLPSQSKAGFDAITQKNDRASESDTQDDTWEQVIESIHLLCLVLGCVFDRPASLMLGGDVENQGWTIVMTYASSGVRTDLTAEERAQGAAAADNLLAQLAAAPSVVSDDLRPLLVSTTESIRAEIRP